MSVEDFGGCDRSLELFEKSFETSSDGDDDTPQAQSDAGSRDRLRLRKVVQKSVLRALSPEDDLRRAYLRSRWRGTEG